MQVIGRMPCSMFHECIHEFLPNCWRKCTAAGGAYFKGDKISLPLDEDLLESSSDSSDDDQ